MPAGVRLLFNEPVVLVGRGVRVLATTPIDEVARRFELEAERVRLLPAGILILETVSDQLGRALQIGKGGLREGAILERIAAAAA